MGLDGGEAQAVALSIAAGGFVLQQAEGETGFGGGEAVEQLQLAQVRQAGAGTVLDDEESVGAVPCGAAVRGQVAGDDGEQPGGGVRAPRDGEPVAFAAGRAGCAGQGGLQAAVELGVGTVQAVCADAEPVGRRQLGSDGGAHPHDASVGVEPQCAVGQAVQRALGGGVATFQFFEAGAQLGCAHQVGGEEGQPLKFGLAKVASVVGAGNAQHFLPRFVLRQPANRHAHEAVGQQEVVVNFAAADRALVEAKLIRLPVTQLASGEPGHAIVNAGVVTDVIALGVQKYRTGLRFIYTVLLHIHFEVLHSDTATLASDMFTSGNDLRGLLDGSVDLVDKLVGGLIHLAAARHSRMAGPAPARDKNFWPKRTGNATGCGIDGV